VVVSYVTLTALHSKAEVMPGRVPSLPYTSSWLGRLSLLTIGTTSALFARRISETTLV